MIESLLHSVVAGLIYSFGFLYYSMKIFECQYTKLKAYILCFCILLPYNVIATVGVYISIHNFNNVTITVLGFLSFLLMILGREIILLKVFHISLRLSIIYQFVLWFMTLLRYSFEDMCIYFIQQIPHYQLEMFLTTIIKATFIIISFYFSTILMKYMKTTFFRKSDYIYFFLCFFMCFLFFEEAGILYNAILSCISLICTYMILLRLSHAQEVRQMKELEERQFAVLQREYKKQKDKHQKISHIRHDQKNHMFTFLILYQQNKEDGIIYLKQWHEDLKNQHAIE